MGVQHTYGGVARVVFPVAAGMLMDRFGVGVPIPAEDRREFTSLYLDESFTNRLPVQFGQFGLSL